MELGKVREFNSLHCSVFLASFPICMRERVKRTRIERERERERERVRAGEKMRERERDRDITKDSCTK